MPRGGKRENSGAKPKWNHGQTTTIRVPVALAKELLEIAALLDNGLSVNQSSKIINLSGIPIVSVQGKRGVVIADLIKAGYTIEPSRLAESVKSENSSLWDLFPSKSHTGQK